MKRLIWAVILFSGASVLAGQLRQKDGVVYKNVTIISADPVRMLIVHDGGGCQVNYLDLVPDSLTVEQRKAVEAGIREHVARSERLERFRIKQEAFELEQREKGLVSFEDNWMTPLQREEILANRESQRLERERLSLELATKKAELEKQKLLAEKAQREIEEQYHRTRYITTYSYYPSRSDCISPVPYRNGHYSASGRRGSSCRRSGGLSFYGSHGDLSFSYRSGSSYFCR
ncbi:MAG: hypothetical protein OES84_02590 [Kiritimatiellaceae bacterium]|nr:hypothetical protein [Kiritimatiellaceae bacterium]